MGARGSDPIQASQALTAFLATQPLVWFPNTLAAFPRQMGTLSTQTSTPPPRKKYSEHTHDPVCPFIQSLMLSEGQSIKDIRSILLRLTTTKPMSSQNLGKDSNEYFSECFSLVKIVLMIEFCWKRFLKVLHFHKYHGFTWAEFLLILF